MHLYPITDLSSIDDITEVETDVINLKRDYSLTWRNKKETYWYLRLLEEVGELGASLANDHEDSPDWELRQIAAICMNWLEMRFEGPIEIINFELEEKHE